MVEERLISNGNETGYLQIGSEEFERMFQIVNIEDIILKKERFMQYVPEERDEARVKDNIIRAKEIGMKNFRIPIMDPSLSDDEETIIYCPRKKPAIDKSVQWWYENIPKIMPEKNSRMCDDMEYDVFLGITQIKQLVDNGCEVRRAWKKICTEWSEDKEITESDLEFTGSRLSGKFYDLPNTYKIVKKRGASFFVFFGGRPVNFFIFHNYPFAVSDDIKNPETTLKNSIGVARLDV